MVEYFQSMSEDESEGSPEEKIANFIYRRKTRKKSKSNPKSNEKNRSGSNNRKTSAGIFDQVYDDQQYDILRMANYGNKVLEHALDKRSEKMKKVSEGTQTLETSF